MGVSSAFSMSGVLGMDWGSMLEAADAPPPTSRHSWSWRELSQRFSWFCLKLLSPPGTQTQEVRMTPPSNFRAGRRMNVCSCLLYFFRKKIKTQMKVLWETLGKFRRLHAVVWVYAFYPNWGMFPWKEFHEASGNFISCTFDLPLRVICSVAYIQPCTLGAQEGTDDFLRCRISASN